MKKTTLLATICAGFEYYDFIIYGLLAVYLSKNFFSGTNEMASIIKIYGIFAAGYLIRPIGGIVFGHWGDVYGRKKTLLISIFLMGVATFLIGVLPTYQQSGLFAMSLLLLARLLQGFAFGAEIPGTITFLLEHTENKFRGAMCGFALSSVSISAALGCFIIYLLNKFLSNQQMLAYGWRIPFLIGGCLIIIGYFIRKNINETPLFIQSRPDIRHSSPLRDILKNHLKSITIGVMISLSAACFIIFGVSMPSFLHQFYHYPEKEIYLFMSFGLVWSAVILPLLGWVSDCWGKNKLFLWTACVMIGGGFFYFQLLHGHEIVGLALFIVIYQIIVAALATGFLAILAELFPTSVRFSGVAICYNLIYSLAGLTPLFLSKLFSANELYVSCFFAVLFMLTACGMTFMPNKRI